MTWDWEGVKEPIRQLYIEQDKPLCEVMSILKQVYDFNAKERTYQKRLKRWGFSKNVRNNLGATSPNVASSSEAQPNRPFPPTCAKSLLEAIEPPASKLDLLPVTSWLVETRDDTLSAIPGTNSDPLYDHSVDLVPLEEHHTMAVMNLDWHENQTQAVETSPSGDRLKMELVMGLKSHPLAIQTATAYINSHGISDLEYIVLYHKTLQDLKGKLGDDPCGGTWAELATTEISLQKLSYEHHHLLLLCSFLDGKRISLELLSRLFNLSHPQIDQWVAKLLQYRLVSQEPHAQDVSIHLNLQSWLQKRLPSHQQSLDAEYEMIRKMSNTVILNNESSKEDWKFSRLAIPHLEAVIMLILRNDSEQFWDDNLFKAATKLVDVVRRLGINDKVIPALEHLRHLMDHSLGSQHPHTLDTLNSLSVTYISTKNWVKAECLLRKLVRFRQDSKDRNELCYLTELNNLIRVLVKRGNVAEARKLQTMISDSVKRIIPKNHLEKMKAEMKLAECFRLCGDLVEAEGHFSRIYKEAKAVLGKDNPHTLRVLELLCHVHFDQKSWINAERFSLDLIELSKRALGKTQVDTVRRIKFLQEVRLKIAKNV